MKTLLAIVIFCISTKALADQFYMAAGFDCNTQQSELSVWFKGAWNEKGESMIRALKDNQWDSRNLIAISQNKNGDYSFKRKTEKNSCQIGKEIYSIEISPLLAPRFHPEGNCATRIGAAARILRGKTLIAQRGIDACTESGTVTTLIKIKPNHPIEFTEIPAIRFFD